MHRPLVINPPRATSSAGRWIPAAVLAALVAAVPHAHAVTAVECSGRYTLTADTVRDNDTGLTWQRQKNPTALTWQEAQTYCQNLTLPGGGWRLPAIFELQTIVDESADAPALDPTAFNSSTENGLFWSSTPDATYPTFAWMVDFGVSYSGGYLQLDHTMLGQNSVRCVRP